MISMISLIAMATLLIRNLPESTKKALKQRAAAKGTSMEEEARQILDRDLRRDEITEVGLGTWLVELFGGNEIVVPPRTEYPRKPPFATDEEWEK